MASIKCGQCTQTHESVAAVKDCYARNTPKQMAVVVTLSDPALPGMTWTRAQREAEETGQEVKALVAAKAAALGVSAPKDDVATEKQQDFIARLRGERGLGALAFTGTKQQASKEISRLMALPKATQTARVVGAHASAAGVYRAEPEDGMYVCPNRDIYKVYKMVHGSGRQGVKRLQVETDHTDVVVTGKFVYLGLASKYLPADARRMTLEEAQEFGKIYGFCVKCGRTLTDETSIANGIGPVCAAKGW